MRFHVTKTVSACFARVSCNQSVRWSFPTSVLQSRRWLGYASCSDAARLQKRNPRRQIRCTCFSDFSRWWTLPLGCCSHRRGTTTTWHSQGVHWVHVHPRVDKKIGAKFTGESCSLSAPPPRQSVHFTGNWGRSGRWRLFRTHFSVAYVSRVTTKSCQLL